jgi:hypothetical protein
VSLEAALVKLEGQCINVALLLAGCANGSIYWTRPNATPDTFLADHKPCFETATIGYGVGSEKAYKACMFQKGWTRVQGSGSQPPSVPYFRGPEDDEEFAAASPEALRDARSSEDVGVPGSIDIGSRRASSVSRFESCLM